MGVHKEAGSELVTFLRHLGLTTDEINVYLHLLQQGPGSVLGISRGIKTGRTKLYPLLDELAGKKLVTVHERHYGTSYQAESPETLSFLVDKQEKLSQELRTGLPAAIHSLKMLHKASPATSKIVDFNGIDGIKQMKWNLAETRSDYFIVELPVVKKSIGKHLNHKIESILDKRPLTGHVLSNMKSPAAPARYIDPAIFKISCETYVYNNVVSLIYNDKNSFYGIEVHNQQLARQYTQLLAVLWQQAVR